jgi:hypothetical protein
VHYLSLQGYRLLICINFSLGNQVFDNNSELQKLTTIKLKSNKHSEEGMMGHGEYLNENVAIATTITNGYV